jgi:TolB-like protein
VLVSSLAALSSCKSLPPPELPLPELPLPELDIDAIQTAINASIDDLTQYIPVDARMAVVDVKADDIYVTDFVFAELITSFVNTRKYKVVDREHLNLIREEQQLGLSGEVSDETAVQIGQWLGAEYVLKAELTPIMGRYIMRIRVLESNTAQIIRVTSKTLDLP